VRVPVEQFSYASVSDEEAYEFLGRAYARLRPSTTRATEGEALRVTGAATPSISVDRIAVGTGGTAEMEPPDAVAAFVVLAGRGSHDFADRQRVESASGDCVLLRPGVATTLSWEPLEVAGVTIPAGVMDRVATELTGIDAERVRFTASRPVSTAGAALWRSTAALAYDHLTAADSLVVNPLIHVELVNTVIAALLSVFPNTTMTGDDLPGPVDFRPAAVRRAVDFVEAHASLPITVTDIAAAADTSTRALRAAFRHHLDTTPTAYLRRARLRGAHGELVTGGPTTRAGVAQVAARWGFHDPARFAAAYLRSYGTAPGRHPGQRR
jgi:AraC-like DNA-binding protein